MKKESGALSNAQRAGIEIRYESVGTDMLSTRNDHTARIVDSETTGISEITSMVPESCGKSYKVFIATLARMTLQG